MKKRNLKKSGAVVVKNTGRSTTEPPNYTPHDFGIDRDWYDTYKSTYAEQVKDYFTYGDPLGFGTRRAGFEEELEEDGELEYTD